MSIFLSEFKECDTFHISDELNLNAKQINALIGAQQSIKTFSDLNKLDSIGATTYRKLYYYFDHKLTKSNEQLSLFN